MYMIRVKCFKSGSDRHDSWRAIMCLKIFNERVKLLPNEIASFLVFIPLIFDEGPELPESIAPSHKVWKFRLCVSTGRKKRPQLLICGIPPGEWPPLT